MPIIGIIASAITGNLGLSTDYLVVAGGGGASGTPTAGTGTAGTANLGGGGGGGSGGGAYGGAGGAGGSGVVILRYADTPTITIGAGLTGTESAASGGYKRATITAGIGLVSWA